MKKFYFTLLFLVFGFLVSAQTSTEGEIVQETTVIERVINDDVPIVNSTKTLLSSVMSTTNALIGNSAEVGITEGQLSVSLNGNANYTIPIAVPKGINNVEPQI